MPIAYGNWLVNSVLNLHLSLFFLLCWLFPEDFTKIFEVQGIDLSQQAQKGRFAFVDGLSKLFSPPGPPTPQTGNTAVQLSAAGGIKGVAASIAQVIKQLSIAGGKPLLILENPDFLLAAVEGVGALDMGDMILELREVVILLCFCLLFML